MMQAQTHATLDTLDRRLLDLMQSQFPLTARPYEALARQAEIDHGTCLARIEALRHERGVIRQTSAIFDTAALGYESSLVAAAVEDQRLEAAAEVVNAHPGVSHNYQRPGRYNLWYTLATPPDSALGLAGTIERLHALSGAESTRALPTLKLFKIGVRFNLGGSPAAPNRGFSEADRQAAAGLELDDRERELIRVLQGDLPIEPAPFDGWAEQAGCSTEQLLDTARRFLARKQMRRFASVLNHRRAGAATNVMAVWAAPEERVEQIGRTLALYDEVSHCYRRPAYEDWPYNLYTMVHAPDRETALTTLERMRVATGLDQPEAMWSVREFKKLRLRYFTGQIKAWEAAHA